MKAQHVDAIKQNLDSLKEIDLKKDIAESFPEDDLSELLFSDIPALDFISLFDRVVKQFEEEIKRYDAIFLPLFYFPAAPNPKLLRSQGINNNTVDSRDIVDTLANFIQQLHAQDYEASALVLKEIIAYQRQNGFWDKSERSIHDPSSLDVERIKSDLEAAQRHQIEVLGALKKVSAEYGNRTADLERWASTAKTRLEEATESNKQISDLLNNSTANDAKLDEIVSNQDDIFSKAKGVQSSLTKKLDEATLELDKIKSSHEESEKYRQEIESTRKEVEELTGMWAGAGLGGKFEKRGRLLRISSYFWLAVVVFSVVGSVWWLSYSTGKFQLDTDNAWLAFVWKLGLITPVAFLLGFVGKQYSKERALEEEYAFRSALSMTLNAFAKQLDQAEGNEPRKKLILETVEKLYQSPKSLVSHESASLPHIRNKSYKETIETLTATVERLGKLNPKD